MDKILKDYMNSEIIFQKVNEVLISADKVEYSNALLQLKSVDEIISLVASLDQSPYQLRQRDL